MSHSSFAAMQRTDASNRTVWMHYTGVQEVLEARELSEVLPLLSRVQEAQKQGLHAIGWIGYEASPAFDPHLKVYPPDPVIPLVRFTLFREEHRGLPRRGEAGTACMTPFRPSLSESEFGDRVQQVRAAIAAGETYQVNLTYPGDLSLSGSAWHAFRRLRLSQAARHQAYLEHPDLVVVSASPELFFRHAENRIICRPMKGTARPGSAHTLRASGKDQAENVMIVDMIRNDLGKCAPAGQVHTDRLFDIEPYPSVLQMTSTVRAEGPATALDWMKALFPCASITGAPKRRTMDWIHRLENAPRGIYTGCIGGFFGDGVTEFNVAIRTAVIRPETGSVRYHTGCGIVWDSDPADEYAESLLKTAVLSHATEPFELIETMRAEPGRGILNSEGHLNRLRTSAEELGFELDEREVQASMENIVHRIDTPSKARLLLNANGTFTLTCDPLPTPAETMTFRIDPGRTPAEHPELRHKTTRRDVYRQARERCPDSDETLMINKRGELMEFTIGNVVVEIDGTAYTPPVSAGLLRGTARESDLKNGTLTERVLTPEDLKRAEGIYLLNAVRGWVEMIHIP